MGPNDPFFGFSMWLSTLFKRTDPLMKGERRSHRFGLSSEPWEVQVDTKVRIRKNKRKNKMRNC